MAPAVTEKRKPKTRVPAETRFWDKVAKTTGCWLWQGSIDRGGYGRFWDGTDNRSGNRHMVAAHIWAYEREHGPVADGLELDHTCRVRNCVRPSHLEPVTRIENIQRIRHDAYRWYRLFDNDIPSCRTA